MTPRSVCLYSFAFPRRAVPSLRAPPPCPPPCPHSGPSALAPPRPGTPRGRRRSFLPLPFSGRGRGGDGGTTDTGESSLGSSVLAHVFSARRSRSNTCVTPAPPARRRTTARRPARAASKCSRPLSHRKANTNVQSLTSAWTHVHTHVGSICGIVQVSTPTHLAAHLPRPPEFTTM